MAEFLVAGLAWGALKLTSSIVSAGFKKLASAGVNRLIGGEEEDAAMVEWSGDIVLKAREKAAGVTTRPTQMAPASRAVEGLQQEVRGGMATLSRDLHSGLGTMGAAAAAEIAGVRSEVRGVKRDLAVVRASVEECRAENMEFFESFTANLESAQESIAIMRSAPLHEADMALKNFEASRGNVRFLETAHSKAMTALVQGHTLDVKLSAGIIAIAAGYVYMSKTDSPSDAKYFTVNGTLSNIVQHFAPIWADPSVAGTPDGKKTLSFLLNLVSCVCVLPADDVPVLPRLDKRLLPAFGALCAAEPELRRLYPAVAGAAVRAMLESKSMKGLFQLADEIDVDAEDCTSKDAVVQALLTSGKSLVPMVPAVSAPVRDAGTDRAALMAFHKATGGPSWESKRGWGTSARLCDWYGVKVDFEGRVVELKLCDNSLAGAIPAQLGALNQLTWLDLSGNQLSGTIPRELGKLTALTTLNLNYNGLTGTIPRELGKLTALTTLNLNYNGLTGEIPASLGQLGNLQELHLSGNNLSVFPRVVAEKFAAMNLTVTIERNPWTEPPADVLEMGMAYTAGFLKDLHDYGRASTNRLKVVLVGLGNAGKTSVAVRLEGRASSKSLPNAEERTVGVEIRDIKLRPRPAENGRGGSAELDVKLWDFAGQRAYYDTHQMFLTPDALFVLVVDMFAYVADGHSREDALEQWLDILQSRVPGSVVLVVGTHGDRFNSQAECSKRVEGFLKDTDDIMERIGRDCTSAKARAQQDLVRDRDENQTGLQANRRHQPLRVVVEEELLALNLASSRGGTTGQLRGAIERVAYHGGYSFPSVNSIVPKTHLLAVATLEAVRRGADLRGSGGELAEVTRRLFKGDPAEGRPFVRLSEALSLFVELTAEQSMFEWFAKIAGQTTEKKRAFLDAIQLHEAQGAILLTKADGGGGEKSRGTPFEEELFIHVNPAWFADLVRRVVDIRLLDPARQGEMVGEMERYAPAASMRNLSRQHWRFIQAGEVSRDYLRFLWRRDMKLGPVSRKAPPLEMSEEAVTAMVGSLLDVRFMFQVRDSNGGILPDRYVVSSCLPDYVGCVEPVDADADPDHMRCVVDPREMLELKKGGAIFSIELKLVGARAVPAGLVPRFLAWCGRGDGRIKACWKQGVCFAFKGKHLVLLYERRDGGQRSVIECHARGSADNEKAGGVLSDVVTELDRLLGDNKYGFPGVGLLETGAINKRSACSDDDLEALLTRLEGALEDHMNVKFEELARKSDEIAGCVRGYLHGAEKRMEDFERTVDTMLGEMKQEIFSKLDFIAAVASKCLLVSIKGDNPCPRLISVEEDVTHTSTLSKFSHFRRKAMDPLRRALGKTKTQQSKPKRYRVRFLCAYDMSAAECGPDGQGYIVESEKDWQRWLQKCLPLVQVSLWLLRVGVSVVARAEILPVDNLMGKLREVAGEETAAYIEAIDVKSFEARNGGLSSKVVKQKEVFDGAYTDLAKFVLEQEKNIVVTSRELGAGDTATLGGGATSENAAIGVPAASTAPVSAVSPTGKRSFEREMVLKSRQRGNDPPQWAWVRGVNLEKWQRFEDPISAAVAQATGAVP